MPTDQGDPIGSKMKLLTSARNTAIDYAKNGWSVLPVLPKKKDPHFDLVKNAYLSATTDIELINFWFDFDEKINIGIACKQSGLIVFDIDYRNGGELSDIFQPTYTVKTGDGIHLYYKAPKGVEFKGGLEQGIDIKFKGYVVAAPSLHPNGSRYEVIDSRNPIEISDDLLEEVSK